MINLGAWCFEPETKILRHSRHDFSANIYEVRNDDNLVHLVNKVWDAKWSEGEDISKLCLLLGRLFGEEGNSNNFQEILARNVQRWEASAAAKSGLKPKPRPKPPKG